MQPLDNHAFGVKRLQWIDIAKGIGIVAVVIGHLPVSIRPYLFWFHMPLFFILSGYLFHPVTSTNDLRAFTTRKAWSFLVPYVSYMILITIICNGFELPTFSNLLRMGFGGRVIAYEYRVFWFITCLYATMVAYAACLLHWHSPKHYWLIIGMAWTVGHIESSIKPLFVPWSLDVVLVTMAYFAFGHTLSRWHNRIPSWLQLASIIITVLLFVAGTSGRISYNIDLKYVHYKSWLLDFVIPCTMSFGVISFSKLLTRWKLAASIFAAIGKRSLAIMYLHIPVNMILSRYVGNQFWLAVFGITVPLLLSTLLLERSRLLSTLFLGLRHQHRDNYSGTTTLPKPL